MRYFGSYLELAKDECDFIKRNIAALRIVFATILIASRILQYKGAKK